MTGHDVDEIHESVAQFIGAWKSLCRYFPGCVIEDLPGISVILSGTPLPLLNMLVLSSPVRDAADLEHRVHMGLERTGAIGHSYMLVLCEPWSPGGDAAAGREQLLRLGQQQVMQMTGMVTDRLTPPARPLPELEFRRVAGEATRAAISDVNSACYAIPVELGRISIGHEAMLRDPGHHGWVGYLDGVPITTSNTTAVDGCLYVSLVATLAEHRRRGYGEAVMRHSLASAMEATGLHRTVLHATADGRPLYEAMGYRSVADFGLYMHVA